MNRILAVGAGVLSLTVAACGGGGGPGGAAAGALVSIVTPSTVPPVQTGQPFQFTIQATFPHPPGAYRVTSGALPVGTELDSETGVISGFPREVGHFSFEVAAQDGVDTSLPKGRDASFAQDRRTFQVEIARGPVQILPQLPPAAQYRASYAYPIDVAGGTPPSTFARPGATLPAGLSVSSTGVIGNFPTQGVPSNYSVEVTVTDALGGTDTASLPINVVILPLLIATSSIPGAAKDFPYDTVLALASAGGGAPHTWSQKPPTGTEVLLS